VPKALTTIALGFHGEIHAGEDVPATYFDTAGEHDTDFAGLAELGLIDKAAATRAEKSRDVQDAKAHVAEAKAELKAADPPKPAPAAKSKD
jgi:hypothetical protein